MKVLVTGANGFVGRHLVSDFVARGHTVNAAARNELSGLPEGATWMPSPSLCSDADFGPALNGCNIVVHSAARVHVMKDKARNPIDEFRAVNVEGTIALARAATVAGVRQFVYLSSVKVSGEKTQNGSRFTANEVSNPKDAYGVSKAEAEKALRKICAESGMGLTVIRPVLVYGPDVKGNFRTMMAVIARGLPLPLGNINNLRSFVYVRNLTDLIVQATEHSAALGKILFASDCQDLSTSALLRMIGNGLNRPARLLPVPQAVQRLACAVFNENSAAQRLLGSLQVDCQTTCETLDWVPPFTVAEGIAETTADYLLSRGL